MSSELEQIIREAIAADLRNRLAAILRIVNDDLSLTPGQKDAMIDRMRDAWVSAEDAS